MRLVHYKLLCTCSQAKYVLHYTCNYSNSNNMIIALICSQGVPPVRTFIHVQVFYFNVKKNICMHGFGKVCKVCKWPGTGL